jgi:hypothetical protein
MRYGRENGSNRRNRLRTLDELRGRGVSIKKANVEGQQQ